MKRGMGKNKKNLGFSLVEVVVAIAMLAIVITPIMSTFVSSHRMNLKARKLMCANDVGQSIMEGFSNMKFSSVSRIITAMEDASAAGNLDDFELTGKNALSNINGNKYNVSESALNNKYVFSDNLLDAEGLRHKSNPSAVYVLDNHVCDDLDINIMTKRLMAYGCLRQYLEMNAAGSTLSDKVTVLGAYKDAKEIVAGFTFTNIKMDGYAYDVCVCFVPMAASDTDTYFPYRVHVAVYDAGSQNAIQSTNILNGTVKPLVTFDSGMMCR